MGYHQGSNRNCPSLGVNPLVFLTQTPTLATHHPPYHFPDGNEPSILHIVLCTLWFFNMAIQKMGNLQSFVDRLFTYEEYVYIIY